jgi:hypothetical protein
VSGTRGVILRAGTWLSVGAQGEDFVGSVTVVRNAQPQNSVTMSMTVHAARQTPMSATHHAWNENVEGTYQTYLQKFGTWHAATAASFQRKNHSSIE